MLRTPNNKLGEYRFKRVREELEKLPEQVQQMIQILKLSLRKKDDIEVLLPLISEVQFFK